MKLKEFLAVGSSFASSPREKSPFGMRKDVRLPSFDHTPRFSTKHPVAVQTDWLAEKSAMATTETARKQKERAEEKMSSNRGARKRSWWQFLTFGLFGKRKPSREFVQAEMNLENVRVLRNDLADTDLEIVFKRKKKFSLKTAAPSSTPVEVPAAPVVMPVQAQVPAPEDKVPHAVRRRQEWSELTAKLFELGQH